MTFGYDPEQQQFADGVRRLLSHEWCHQKRRDLIADGLAIPTALWRQMEDLGWLGFGITPTRGGSGGGAVELVILAEAIGGALAPLPFLGAVTLCAPLLAEQPSSARADDLLASLLSGEGLVALAAYEPALRFDALACAATAVSKDNGFVINGQKVGVLDGALAETFLVLARVEGKGHELPLGLFAVSADAPGVTVRPYRTYDGRLAANVTFDGVIVMQDDRIDPEGGVAGAVEKVLDRGTVALCAEAVGAMQAAYELTLAHVVTRQQFGGPIGRFQVIQHRLVDMYVAIEECRSMVLAAAFSLDAPRNERRRLVSAAKLRIGRLGRFCAEQCVQIHGAIAISDEYSVGDYFKLLLTADTLFGDADHHAGLLGQQIAA
jgi:alkylation response protein AidB-like acyl-CoA dehydrogenase